MKHCIRKINASLLITIPVRIADLWGIEPQMEIYLYLRQGNLIVRQKAVKGAIGKKIIRNSKTSLAFIIPSDIVKKQKYHEGMEIDFQINKNRLIISRA